MKVSLVGAGPGDPKLLTLRGRELLATADVVIYDALANPALLDFAKAGAELIYVGKIADNHALPQDKINALLVEKAMLDGGKNVVRLKGGDPYIFGRGGEEALYLQEHGVPFEEVPGITSAIAAPAYAGIPLTHRDFTSSVTILTGHEKSDGPASANSAHNWEALAKSGSTLVFVMGMKNLADIAANLIGAGLDPQTPAAVIYRGTLAAQRFLSSSIERLPRIAREQNFTNPAVIVIGKVVDLHDKLDWFAALPLHGRRVVVTRAREQASALAQGLESLGAETIECPAIEIAPPDDYGPLDAAIANLQSYDWLIFTSVNGVDRFWDRLDLAGGDSRSLSGLKIAAIGPATSGALQKKGIHADFVPQTYVAEEVAKGLITTCKIKGTRILLARAANARMVLPEDLARAGATVDIAPVYKTVPATGCVDKVIGLLNDNKLDCITFGSSSTVHNFMQLVSAPNILKHGVALAAIGPVTAVTLGEYGLTADIVPHDYTIPGLIAAIAEHFKNSATGVHL